MHSSLPRRDFLTTPALGAAAILLAGPTASRLFAASDDPVPNLPPGYPRQDPALVKEIVTVAHFNEARVRELIERHPALANAWWDWGFGDWESPLGAAAHMGRREIAEFLIQRGARPDLFAAAMLGHLDIVKATIAAHPGVQRTLGPHGIPLLAHAKAGGERAKPVADYLESLGDADAIPKILPLTEDDARRYLGAYAFGPAAADRFVVRWNKDKLMFVKGDDANRPLHRVAEHEFFPAGVPSIRITFDIDAAQATALRITDPRPVLTAKRIGD